MKKYYLIITLLALLLSIDSQAQRVKYSNEFLSLGVGARSLAMGGAVAASVRGIYSTYWNPAALTGMQRRKELALMHSEYFAGIAKYDYGAFASRAGSRSALGFSFVRFGVDNIPNTSQLIDAEGNVNYDKVLPFSAVDFAFFMSYAHRTAIHGLSYGVNTKIIRRRAGTFASSYGFGIDLGLRYVKNQWTFGALFKDVTTTFNSWTYTFSDEMIEVFTRTGNDIPLNSTEITRPSISLGAARLFKAGEKISLLAEADIRITTDGKRNVALPGDPFSLDPFVGLEAGYAGVVFLRAGLNNIQKESMPDAARSTSFQPNIGLGVNIKSVLTIDYALTDIGNQSLALYSHIFSVKFCFNTKTDKEYYDEK